MTDSLRRRVARAARNHEWPWRYLLNRRATFAYRRDRPEIADPERRIAQQLRRDGIASTTVAELMGSTDLFEELQKTVCSEEERRRDEVLRVRREANEKKAIGQKTFLLELLGHSPVFDPASVFARFALQRPFLRIAGAYFGMYTVLRYYNVWHNFPFHGEARESQLWHRDREDFLILKVFVYLSDVEDGAGPLSYVPASHRQGRLRGEAESFVEGNVRRSSDDQMARFARRESWVRAVGKAGTIVFADTRGYHKGGLARESDRLLFVTMFTSPRSSSEKLLLPGVSLPPPPDREQEFALLDARGYSPRSRRVDPS